MAVNKLVSIKIPVLNALEDMGIDIAKDRPVFTRWASEAEREIGSYYSYRKKIKVLNIDHCVATLPCEAAFVQYAILGDHGCECDDLFNRCSTSSTILGASTTDTFLIVDAFNSDTSVSLSGVRWEVQDNKLIFTRNYDLQKVTVQYLGFQEDAEGFPLVMENHIGAIVEYIMYRYAVRSRFTPVKMDHSDISRLWREWMRLASHARADDAELSDSDRQEIVSMIHDPFMGYGMNIGSSSMNYYNGRL